MDKPYYPIYATDNRCVHCGSKNGLYRTNVHGGKLCGRSFFDKNDNTDIEGMPFYGYKCSNCGREYFISWINDFSTPIPVSMDEMEEFKDRFDKGVFLKIH